ncbi:unnamed protein product [Hermetia illucens]|uniref:C2H2-type domain-containing protein n=1 Tax=Hermetia illucens TaxID=343691 RepID=A0A7R8YUJ9_HERIL|nr:zinc finger protein 26 [Hermetia illucens]CAD7085862.1 unnamed protein product [Hermetia illucens]
MLGDDMDDTHLCIKCSRSIVGLENYIQHRKTNCSSKASEPIPREPEPSEHHQYRNFGFTETPNYHKPEEVVKTNKSLTDSYDIPYDLGADVFFSSLELQSSSRKPIPNPTPVSTSGKHSSSTKILTRKATAALLSHNETNDDWISPSNNTDSLMKAVRDISGTKKCDNVFIVPFQHDSPEPSEEEDDDDEDYEGPPSTHTGGKWKPGNTLSPTILRNSPAWDDRSQWEPSEHDDEKVVKTHDNDDFDHDLIPPPGHTKGKWVPGTKIVKLDYKEEVEVEKIFSDQYWCNTCNRKLATKLLYERHIKSSLHLKRSEPEQELEQAIPTLPKISERVKKRSVYLNADLYLTENPAVPEDTKSATTEKQIRKRRKYFMRCETCKMRLRKDILGKHLISHYHYRRMSRNPGKSFDLVLKNIDKIVHQAPYQCQPCRFYTNTQEDFMNHWNCNDHADVVEGPGRFCCNFCKFECEDNNQMRRHLLGQEHREVILAVNRSFPIVIGKRISIECPKCKQGFRYNIELRKHAGQCTREPAGTASNDYQSKFICPICKVSCKSQLALQKHRLRQHKNRSFFCSICKIEFNEALEAKKHRSSSLHRVTAATLKNTKCLSKKCQTCSEVLKNLLELKKHLEDKHPDAKHACPHCGDKFLLPQEISRHIRDKICQPSTSQDPLKQEVFQARDEVNPGSTACTSKAELCPTGTSKEWNCSECSYRSPLKAELLYHQVLHNYPRADINTQLPCSICEKTFRKYSLRYHLRQHTNERVFECDQCQMKFSRKYNLKTHVDNIHCKKQKEEVTSEKPASFQCDVCGKCFNNKHCLTQHGTVHKERDQKFKCPVEGCIYIARSSGELKVHWSAHTTEKIFPCSVSDCNYKGKTLVLLKRHMKIHKPVDKTFDCPHCDFKAKIPGHLKRHIRIHTGEKPYKCPYCTFQCNTSENLRKHVLTTSIHTGRSLYECQYCGPTDFFKTNFQKEYRTHLVVVHHVKS